VPDIGVEELSELLLQDKRAVVIVDCREKAEQDVSMIPGAIRQAEFEAKEGMGTIQAPATVVAYCTIGYRSGLFINSLREKADGQDKDVELVNLRGSLLAWCHSGRPLVSGLDPTQDSKTIHTYGSTWALPPDGYDAIYYTEGFATRVFGKVLSWWARAKK
jgi:rhodanese-related sulfurtransferase